MWRGLRSEVWNDVVRKKPLDSKSLSCLVSKQIYVTWLYSLNSTPMDDSSGTWTFSQSFTHEFQAMRSGLQHPLYFAESRRLNIWILELVSRIEAIKAQGSPSQDSLQDLSVSLAKMTKALGDATGQIPSYDQKQYENVRLSASILPPNHSYSRCSNWRHWRLLLSHFELPSLRRSLSSRDGRKPNPRIRL